MNGRQLRLQLTLVLAILAVCSLAAQAPAWAQAGEGWSFVITPQVWISHISQNGFTTANLGALTFVSGIVGPDGAPLTNAFQSDSSPNDVLNPQWGLQLAAQRGRWTLAGSFQYVNFETKNDIRYTPQNGLPLCGSFSPRDCLAVGDKFDQEFVNTTRMDIDFAASYLFPDVVQNRLDLSLGSGFKFIYASASRQFANLSQVAAEVNGLFPNGLYAVCGKDDCSDVRFKDRVKTKDYFYGATIPMSAIVHLTSDARWLLPLSITPFIGAETRDDRDVVYALREIDGTVRRLDGSRFAYGVTGDATVRWIINDTLSAYAGMRVQYIKGHEKYLAYGPLVGMSVRFGGK
jgi:hypothetical protein